MNGFLDTAYEIGRRLTAGFTTLFGRLPSIIADPRAYPREAMLLAAMLALLLLLVILAFYVISDAAQSVRARSKLGVERRVKRWPIVAAFAATILVLGVAVTLIVPTLAVTSGACGSCHATVEPVAAWERGPHASVSCYGCHARPGVLGTVEATLRGAGERLAGTETSQAASPVVFTGGCLDCHDDILNGVVEGTVRVRHSDIVEGGWACTDCHASVGHEGLERVARSVQRSVMSECLICHDGQTAPAECDTCHASGPMDTATTVTTPGAGASFTCQGCHSEKTDQGCVDCHGLVLPHPDGFMAQHAALSWNNPALCERCHEEAASAEGCGCHSDVNLHGTYTEWFPRHGPAAFEVFPGGCNCHAQVFCEQCHLSSPFK